MAARRAIVQTSGARAMLAYVGGHEPGKAAAVLLANRNRALNETDVTPSRCTELNRIVVRHARKVIAIVGQLIPLLAGDLAGLTANAEGSVREKAGHGYVPQV